MVKIKILDKGFKTTHFGYLEAGSTVEVPGHFADYCVDRMKAAVKVAPVKAAKKKAVKK